MTSRCNHYSTICRYCNHYLWDLADSPRCFDCFVNHINYFLTINTGSYDVSIRRLRICRRWGGLAGHRRPHSLSSGSCGKRPSPEYGRDRMTGPARQRRRRAGRHPRMAQALQNGGVRRDCCAYARAAAGASAARHAFSRRVTAGFGAPRLGKGVGGRGGTHVWRRRCKTAGLGGTAARVRGPPPALPPHGTHFPGGS